MIITRPAYTLEVSTERPRATLSDPDGRVWSVLSLVGTADRVDARDETLPGVTTEVVEEDGVSRVVVTQPSAAWARKAVVLECHPDRVAVRLEVAGDGWLTEVSLLGGRAILPTGAAGTFRSSTGFASVFVPTPTEPIAVARPAAAAAVLSAVGDAEAGRLNGIFSPPPLCFAFGREAATRATKPPKGAWLAAWVDCPIDEMTFTQVGYSPLDGGFRFTLDYEAHTVVDGAWTSPTLVLRPTASAWTALAEYAEAVTPPPPAQAPDESPAWWLEPIFCGWGAQCALAAARLREAPLDDAGMVGGATVFTAAGLATQENYDRWLAHLADHGVNPGTVVLDDKWQLHYGDNDPDPAKWPDLKAWIARQHGAGRRVLLWFKAWDPQGLPPEECIVDALGTPIAADPGSPAYQERLRDRIGWLLGPDGLDADGFKVDFTQRLPTGASLRGRGPWGIAGLHRLMAGVYAAAKAAKPDALVINHTVHPAFADTTDMVRLNDVLRYDTALGEVPVAHQLRFRAKVAAAVLPGKPIDTDQWPMPNRAEWLAYADKQWRLGVPALYYVDRIDNSGEAITPDDLAFVAQTWERYREER